MYLIPDFSKLLELQVWADAGQQIFFSLTLCQGVVGTLASFNDFHQQCLTNTLVVVVVNCVTSFWIGIPIFAVLGHMAHELGTTVAEVTFQLRSCRFCVDWGIDALGFPDRQRR